MAMQFALASIKNSRLAQSGASASLLFHDAELAKNSQATAIDSMYMDWITNHNPPLFTEPTLHGMKILISTNLLYMQAAYMLERFQNN